MHSRGTGSGDGMATGQTYPFGLKENDFQEATVLHHFACQNLLVEGALAVEAGECLPYAPQAPGAVLPVSASTTGCRIGQLRAAPLLRVKVNFTVKISSRKEFFGDSIRRF